jgi:hypothetical protein
MKICIYKMTVDTGFAPNPFHGICTLAACTPNRMNARLDPRDYIAGFRKTTNSYGLVFWMNVDGWMDYQDYFTDHRFRLKKPRVTGTWQERCGDNIYYRKKNGQWHQIPSIHHTDEDEQRKDLKNHIAYFGTIFSYQGKHAEDSSNQLLNRFHQLLPRRGIKYCRAENMLQPQLLQWLTSFHPGIHGDPKEWENNMIVRTSPCSVPASAGR